MGKYINEDSKGIAFGASAKSKLDGLVNDGAKVIPQPDTFQENLVCVVDNGPFGAAGYCDSPEEFQVFTSPTDYRPKTWLIYEHAEAVAQ